MLRISSDLIIHSLRLQHDHTMLRLAMPTQPIASPSTVRVEFENIRFSSTGLCSSGRLKIDRRFPPNLQSYLSQTSWNDFCNQIDDAFLPLAKSQSKSCFLCLFVSFVILVPLIVVQILAFTGKLRILPNSSIRVVPIFMIVGFFFVIIAACLLSCQHSRLLNEAMERANGICKDFSSRYSSINIHLREIRKTYTDSEGNQSERIAGYFIEFMLLPSTTGVGMDREFSYAPSMVVQGTLATPVMNNPSGKTIEQRMADLESIRSVLTDEEYREKRNQILSQV